MKNNQTNKFLPVWAWAIILIQIFLVYRHALASRYRACHFIPDVSELNYVTQLYITRNVTIALGMIVALFLRSHKALLVTLIVRLLTDISDVITVYTLNVEVIKESVPMVVVLLIIPAFVAIGYLWKRINQ